MTWVKLDDGFPDHPKVIGLSDQAFRLYVSGLCYCSRFLTDGDIPTVVVSKLGSGRYRAELVAAGLWNADSNGVTVSDYLGHQRSRQQVERERVTTAERASRWRDNHRSNGVTNAVSTEEVRPPELETELDKPPLPPAKRGAKRRNGTNPRQSGTNPRGPSPALSRSLAQQDEFDRNERRDQGKACESCGDTGLVLDGNDAKPCQTCAETVGVDS